MSTLTEVLFIERCLNLLKPGGRMGIVLPEGVLNNTNLQKIREYVESKAKIILITSIPQDVFIASGATVKPSLLFFKKFTEEEEKEWKRITEKAKKDVEMKYKPIEEKEQTTYENLVNELNSKILGKSLQPSIMKIDSLLKSKGLLETIIASTKDYTKYEDLVTIEDSKKAIKEAKAIFQNEIKRIQSLKEAEIKSQIKKEFDYEIPIAEVEKAGISTTGAVIENELEPLAKEFVEYRKSKKLWDNKFETISYEIMEEDQLFRMVAGEPEIFYGK
jgi:type I restriction enzyme M protein